MPDWQGVVFSLLYIEMWRRWVARFLGVEEAVGSSPAISTIDTYSNFILLKNNCRFESYSARSGRLRNGKLTCLQNKQNVF